MGSVIENIRNDMESCDKVKDNEVVISEPPVEKANGKTSKSSKRVKKVNCEITSTAAEKEKKTDETFFLLPNEFEIILYVDTKEIER